MWKAMIALCNKKLDLLFSGTFQLLLSKILKREIMNIVRKKISKTEVSEGKTTLTMFSQRVPCNEYSA